ncbi:MAG: elongation factor Ts [Candidatus Buchananbacteria bacterium CG10_big_fil_rev_8_21_14_0_10_42_9]|uniref:Elongation factor Ts n=1 Tax=Candidatus Buchananbacteria bacterium CG10_big_fil_rev_8_21_14_0_10_42_9 TaxID=1974526 RepID=A0A2H0W2I0_9BACT|nr:MAG: elongation factor Ts [Candidatus Buchananbacteria bacterium CG10_big_fil_rev_8_21_14_0_10_42_9]
MAIDTSTIKQLREQTGVGVADVKSALEEAQGDTQKALEILRVKSAVKASKKASREATEGLVASYIHTNGKVGVLVDVSSETDFVARNDEFKQLVNDIAMHIAAADPLYVKAEDVPAEVLTKEKEIIAEQLKEDGKTDEMIAKIMPGKIDKYYEEVCLLNQPFIKDDSMTIAQLIEQKIGALGEKIEVRRFARFQK